VSTPKRFVSWAAVSSLPQAKKVSLDEQLRVNREHIERHGGQLVEELVVPGESRSIVLFEEACRRIDAYARLKQLIDARAFDVLIFLDRSRLGRKASLSMAVVELCSEVGIACYETDAPPTTLDDAGRNTYDDMLIGAIKSVGAQREVEKFRERSLMGRLGRVKKGKFPSVVPWGWRAHHDAAGNQHIEIDEEAAAVVRLAIVDLYLTRGLGMPGVAEELNRRGYRTPNGKPWTDGNLTNITRRIWRFAGYGEMFVRGPRPTVRAKGSWPPILSEAEVEAFLEEKRSRAQGRRAVHAPHRFSRLVVCERHGCNYRILKNHHVGVTKQSVYVHLVCPQCKGGDEPRYLSPRNVHDALYVLILEIQDRANWPRFLTAPAVAESDIHKRIETQRAAIRRAQEAVLRTDDAYAAGAMDLARYTRQVQRQESAIADAEQEIEQLEKQIENLRHEERRIVRLEEIAVDGLKHLADPDMRRANAWLRRRFRVSARDRAVTHVDVL
jgi:DNA invertase Pin-like site-specific DNA recombinase